jgi:hypothetical protein
MRGLRPMSVLWAKIPKVVSEETDKVRKGALEARTVAIPDSERKHVILKIDMSLYVAFQFLRGAGNPTGPRRDVNIRSVLQMEWGFGHYAF